MTIPAPRYPNCTKIQQIARADAIKEAVEVVESYADSIGNPSVNVIAALEALKEAR